MNENGKVAEASRLWPNNNTNPFYNPWAETIKNQGAHLPHWHQDGVLYFITFRLADSLPQEKLKIFTQEKEVWLNQNPEPHNSEQKAEYYERFVMRIQQWLDLGYGSMILRDKEAKSLVTNVIQYFDGSRYRLDTFVVAANHVHALLMPQGDHTLSNILHSWKSFSAKELLKLPIAAQLTTAPKVWQKESWDHIVRSKSSLNKFREYIQAHSS
jgi:REP element-mobilizing transposase RayT